jgi:hypothetical protein
MPQRKVPAQLLTATECICKIAYSRLRDITLNFFAIFLMECAAREVDFSDFGSPVASAGWLAIIAFLTTDRLLISDFFSIDMVTILSRVFKSCTVPSHLSDRVRTLDMAPSVPKSFPAATRIKEA